MTAKLYVKKGWCSVCACTLTATASKSYRSAAALLREMVKRHVKQGHK